MSRYKYYNCNPQPLVLSKLLFCLLQECGKACCISLPVPEVTMSTAINSFFHCFATLFLQEIAELLICWLRLHWLFPDPFQQNEFKSNTKDNQLKFELLWMLSVHFPMVTRVFSILSFGGHPCVIPFSCILKICQTKLVPNEHSMAPVLTLEWRELHGGIQSRSVSGADLGWLRQRWSSTDPLDFDWNEVGTRHRRNSSRFVPISCTWAGGNKLLKQL